jgi:hypothetical protein
MGTPSTADASRTLAICAALYAWVPWEKLNRAMFIPLRIRDRIASADSVAGPRVQTIWALRIVFIDSPLCLIALLSLIITGNRKIVKGNCGRGVADASAGSTLEVMQVKNDGTGEKT